MLLIASVLAGMKFVAGSLLILHFLPSMSWKAL